MDLFTCDVLVVGGGGAGLRAAIAVAETHPRLRVAVISKVYPMRSHTVSAEGGAAAVIKAEDSLDAHAYDTISGGDWLCDQDAVEAFVQEAPEEMLRLEHWGCPWNREPDGHIAVRPFGGMKIERTWFAADKTGFHLLHSLFQTTLKYDAIQRYDEFFVTKLLVDEGRCQGVVAIELSTGQIRAITAKAVILCTGGCGKVFPFTTNANIKNGDGMALAYRAGAPLKDMEFVQYHPTGLPFTGILITEAARAEGGWLLNKDGYRYLQDYDLGTPTPKPVLRSMELGPRDRLSQCFVKEQEKGRTFEGPYGHYVHLDIRHLGEKLIDKKITLPHIVFATAFDQYAVKAFEVNAIDYLLKPFDKKRVTQAVEKARKRAQGASPDSGKLDSLVKLLEAQRPQNSKVLLRSAGRLLLVDQKDVCFASIEDGIISVVATNLEGQSNCRTLEELLQGLDPDLFWRAHRSFVVNINRIKEVVPWFKSSYQLRMEDRKQTEIPVSRAQTKRLRELFGL